MSIGPPGRGGVVEHGVSGGFVDAVVGEVGGGDQRIVAGADDGSWVTTVLGTTAVTLAMINVIGGYFVTDRMLGMFKKKDTAPAKKEGSS